MDILEFKTKIEKPCVMCLGYFDAMHKGHTHIIQTAYNLAKEKGLLLVVFLFTGGKNNSPDIFTFEERLIKLKVLNVDAVIYQKLDKEFMSLSSKEFTDLLFSNYNIKYVLTGNDYNYGKNKSGNTQTLKEEALKHNGELITVNEVSLFGEKISTQTIKQHLTNGDIVKANALLGSNYFIRERVIKGKELGKTIGFPTINMKLSKDKLLLGSGVYITMTIIDGKPYSCITNVGSQPTVNGEDFVVETYIKNFDGNLYDKKMSIYFVEKIRDVKNFESLEKLKEQLKLDLELI